MRLPIAILVGACALVAASAGATASSAVERRACAPLDVGVQIQILGDVAGGWQLRRAATLPKKTTVIAVWSKGGPAASAGLAVYGWTARSRSGFYAGCARSAAGVERPGSLRAAFRVKDGWFLNRKYTCIQPGRFVVDVRDVPGGRRITVRVQRTGEVLAVGEVKAGGGWLRGSKRCAESSL